MKRNMLQYQFRTKIEIGKYISNVSNHIILTFENKRCLRMLQFFGKCFGEKELNGSG